MGNGPGLKQQWGVNDPAKAGSDKQSQQFQAAFQKELAALNGFLQYTSANADPAAHDPLEKRRDALYPAFQSTLAQIDRTDPSKAKGAIDKVLGDVKALCAEAGTLKKAAEKALNDWQARVAKYDAAVRQVEELEAWGEAKATALRGLVDGIRTQTNQRKYAAACVIVDQLLPKLKPLYDDYQKQKAAKPQYEQALAEQGARLDALKGADRPSQPMTAKIGEADAALGQARSKADAKDFVGGLEQMKAVKTAADALEKLDKDPQRAKFLASRPTAEELISGSLDTTFKSLEADRNAILELRDHVDPNADAGDYAGANKALTDLQTKATAYQKKVEELQKQKQAYDEALAALQPKLTEASQSKYPKLDPMQQDMVTVQGQMETAAQNEDFVQALKSLKDLSAKVDAYAKALEELEQQKEAYDQALAALQPKLTEASECRYPKLTPLQEELTTVQGQMEAAAASDDFVKALSLLKDLSSKLDAYAKQLALLDQQKKEFEDALGPANAKVADAFKHQFLDLAPKQNEITKLQQKAAALAQAGDYDQAMPVLKELTTKADAYLAAAAKEVEPPILGDTQNGRSQALLKKMSEADQKAVSKVLEDAKSEPEKQFILKGLAAGHSAKELQDFAKKIQGKDANWMRDNLSLTGSSTGKGVKQQWSTSCNATMVEAVHGQMDPVYALKMHEDNPDLDQADNADGTKKNPKLAADQKAMLTSGYKGGSGGAAVARSSGGGQGRWADDLLNNMSDTTGVTYTTKKIDATTKVDDAVKAIDTGVGKGQPVPIVIGNSSTSYTHYVLVTGMDQGPPKRYTIHDPWSGDTLVRTEAQIKAGTLNIAGSNQISAFEQPAEKEVK
jgi:predicted  nucleic acid-binding Zn-ribbon protein